MNNSHSEAYAAAGVDITAGYKSVELMKKHIRKTTIPGVCEDVGGFGGLFALDLTGISHPVRHLTFRRRPKTQLHSRPAIRAKGPSVVVAMRGPKGSMAWDGADFYCQGESETTFPGYSFAGRKIEGNQSVVSFLVETDSIFGDHAWPISFCIGLPDARRR